MQDKRKPLSGITREISKCVKIGDVPLPLYVLAFPGIFRGALYVREKINEEMKIAATYAIANNISDEELDENDVIPSSLRHKPSCK